MAWLLDTHGLLWALYDPGKLGRRSRLILEDPTEEVWVSPIIIVIPLIVCWYGRRSAANWASSAGTNGSVFLPAKD